MIRHALVQFKPLKARLEQNLAKFKGILRQLKSEDIDVLTLPEAAFSGYFLQAGVREQALEATHLYELLSDILKQADYQAPLDVCLGFYECKGRDFYNSALYAEFNTNDIGIKHVHRKMFLPTYGVFDEERYVSRGHEISTFDTRFGKAGLLICEDAWHSLTAAVLALKGADILYIPTASPARDFTGKVPANAQRWQATAKGIAAEHGVYVVTTSLVGSEGGKGFTGYSHVVDPYGKPVAVAPLFREHILITEVHLESIQVARYESPLLADLQTNLPILIKAFQNNL